MDVIMSVGLANCAQGFPEVAAVVMLAGLVHIGEDDQNMFSGVACEGVRGQSVNMEAELFHVLLEGFSPIEGVPKCGHLDAEHFLLCGPFGGGGDGVK
jgi:hypothetical protein